MKCLGVLLISAIADEELDGPAVAEGARWKLRDAIEAAAVQAGDTAAVVRQGGAVEAAGVMFEGGTREELVTELCEWLEDVDARVGDRVVLVRTEEAAA